MNRLFWTLLLIRQLVLLASTSSGNAFELYSDFSETDIHGNIHLGAGISSGGRVGIGLQVRSFYFETAYGAVLQNFIGFTDPDNRLTFGYIRDQTSLEKNFSFWGPNVDAGVFWAPF